MDLSEPPDATFFRNNILVLKQELSVSIKFISVPPVGGGMQGIQSIKTLHGFLDFEMKEIPKISYTIFKNINSAVPHQDFQTLVNLIQSSANFSKKVAMTAVLIFINAMILHPSQVITKDHITSIISKMDPSSKYRT